MIDKNHHAFNSYDAHNTFDGAFEAFYGVDANHDGLNAYDAFDDLVKVCKGRQTLVKHQLQG